MNDVTLEPPDGAGVRSRAAGRFLAVFAISMVTMLVAMILLPHDKYLRYLGLTDRYDARAHWVYERIHFDPTPIDVAFIGSSRTGRSVNTVRLEADLSRRGMTAKAVNLFMYKEGRDMQYVIAKELLEHRRVRLLVLEITELEDRKSHPDFAFLADTPDVLLAPIFINVNYFANLAHLPGRQVDLFVQTSLDRFGLRHAQFAPSFYLGSNRDVTEYLEVDGKRHYFSDENSLDKMERLRRAQESQITPPLLPGRFNWLEYRLPRYYVQCILDLAAQHHTAVVFLYLPRYGGPLASAFYGQYAERYALLNPAVPLIANFRFWSDENHLNSGGAQLATDAIADMLVDGGYLRPAESLGQ